MKYKIFLGAALIAANGSAQQFNVNISHPTGATYSTITGLSGNRVMGNKVAGGISTSGTWNLDGSGFVATTGNSSDIELIHYSGGQQVGTDNFQATLWNGSGNTRVSLEPAGALESSALGTNGTQQVGYVLMPGQDYRASLWSGSQGSLVDLHPAGYNASVANGIGGNQQVGYAYPSSGGDYRAVLWTGSASSVIDLHPSGYDNSVAYRTSGTQQVGAGLKAGATQPTALMWSGDALSAIDLNPAGATMSFAVDVFNGQQTGTASFSTGSKAILWNGSASNYVDLHSLLVSSSTSITFVQSVANGFSADGSVFGYGIDSNNFSYGVVWSPTAVPEPATMAVLGLGLLGFVRRRRASN